MEVITEVAGGHLCIIHLVTTHLQEEDGTVVMAITVSVRETKDLEKEDLETDLVHVQK